MRCNALLLGILSALSLTGADADAQAITQQAYLKASNAAFQNHFGDATAISGDTLVVTAIDEDGAATGVNGDQGNQSTQGSGAAYVFVRDGNGWTQQAYLKASNTGNSDQFGRSVAISGDTIVVGAWHEDSNATGVNGDESNNGTSSAGAAYVFARNGTSWSQQAYLKASNPDANDRFGVSVSISGDTIVVGASGERSNATGVNGDQGDNSLTANGAAYVFVRAGSTWTQQAYLKASTAQALHVFGYSAAVSGDTVVVGAYGDNSGATGVNGEETDASAQQSGAAYVFVRTGTNWSQQAYLKASNTGTNDFFGWSVALADDTVVVGAYVEGSAAIGVDGDQGNEGAPVSGAAYVFSRSGVTWSQQAYLKASNTEAGDKFAQHVAVSGDAVLVGAVSEDSRDKGVNGSQSDNSAPAAGAAYLFVRSGSSWSQAAYLKASNTDGYDEFGDSVALWGDTAVIGAHGEWSAATGVNGNQGDNSAFGTGAAYVFDLDFDAWKSLGSSLAGTAGHPLLTGTGPLTAGSSNQLDVTHAKPSAAATLVFGVTLLNAPFKGGTLVPMPLRLVPLATDAQGALSLPFTWPASAPASSTLYYQCWIADAAAVAGFSASNGLKSTSP